MLTTISVSARFLALDLISDTGTTTNCGWFTVMPFGLFNAPATFGRLIGTGTTWSNMENLPGVSWSRVATTLKESTSSVREALSCQPKGKSEQIFPFPKEAGIP